MFSYALEFIALVSLLMSARCTELYNSLNLIETCTVLYGDPIQKTRVTFNVSASCFAASMAVRQNARDLAHEYPLAAETVERPFYVDDCLSGADDVKTVVTLQRQLQDLFSSGGFLLRKWNSSEASVLRDIPSELCECQNVHSISDVGSYTKTLGLEWNTTTDMFHLTISKSPPPSIVTKRALASDIAKVFGGSHQPQSR